MGPIRIRLAITLLASTASPVLAQYGPPPPPPATPLSDWGGLLDQKKPAEAEKLCNAYVDSAKMSEKVEAQKCLANVALFGNDAVSLQGDDSGGGSIGSTYKPEAADKALRHLNIAINLNAQDLSLHQGRLHILEVTMRYDAMIQALKDSIAVYQGADGLKAWLAYAPELGELRQYKVGLEWMRVLEKYYPNSPDVIGNVGAFLSMQGESTEAIPYLEKAAKLDPKDAINAWDLGRAYDNSNQIALADQWYQKGLALDPDHTKLEDSLCLYAEFVEEKLHDRKRACTLQTESCTEDKRSACASK